MSPTPPPSIGPKNNWQPAASVNPLPPNPSTVSNVPAALMPGTLPVGVPHESSSAQGIYTGSDVQNWLLTGLSNPVASAISPPHRPFGHTSTAARRNSENPITMLQGSYGDMNRIERNIRRDYFGVTTYVGEHQAIFINLKANIFGVLNAKNRYELQDLRGDTPYETFPTCCGGTEQIVISDNRCYAATVSIPDDFVGIWSLNSRQLIKNIKRVPDMQVEDELAFSPNGDVLLLMRHTGSLDLWNLKQNMCEHHVIKRDNLGSTPKVIFYDNGKKFTVYHNTNEGLRACYDLASWPPRFIPQHERCSYPGFLPALRSSDRQEGISTPEFAMSIQPMQHAVQLRCGYLEDVTDIMDRITLENVNHALIKQPLAENIGWLKETYPEDAIVNLYSISPNGHWLAILSQEEDYEECNNVNLWPLANQTDKTQTIFPQREGIRLIQFLSDSMLLVDSPDEVMFFNYDPTKAEAEAADNFSDSDDDENGSQGDTLDFGG